MGDGEWEEEKPEMIRGSKHSVDMRCERTLTTVENASRNAVREWDSQNIKSILPFNCCKHSTKNFNTALWVHSKSYQINA